MNQNIKYLIEIKDSSIQNKEMFIDMFLKSTGSCDLYVTFRDFSNHFQYIPFIKKDKMYLNEIKNKNCSQVIPVPTWYPHILLKPYLYYQSLPKYF